MSPGNVLGDRPACAGLLGWDPGGYDRSSPLSLGKDGMPWDLPPFRRHGRLYTCQEMVEDERQVRRTLQLECLVQRRLELPWGQREAADLPRGAELSGRSLTPYPPVGK